MRLAAFAVLLLLSITFSRASAARAEDISRAAKLDKNSLVSKPDIEYPFEARRARMVGRGVVLIEVDPATGKVISTRMAQSTGHTVLDNASTTALKSARFAKGSPKLIKVPINWTLTGAGVPWRYDVKSKNMDDVLARFLGKGTVVKGPIPAYPKYPPWTNKSGKGVYELHADNKGKMKQVRILKSSGDETFDRETVKTLGKWRLRSGRPVILELPLSFVLTPTKYSVDVSR